MLTQFYLTWRLELNNMFQAWKLVLSAFSFGAVCFFGLTEACQPTQSPTSLCQYKAKTTEDLIKCGGYPVETHTVKTEDNYLLLVHRIPCGKDGPCNTSSCTSRPVVLLWHGLFASDACWVFNKPENNLAFLLADNGYDVWMANSRGVEGTKHVTLKENDRAFWNFSFDEMAKYDVPDVIDYILNQTCNVALSYVGHSQGTMIVLAFLSIKPDYNEKIKCLVLLSPATTTQYITSATRIFEPASFIINQLDDGSINLNSEFFQFIKKFACEKDVISDTLCIGVFFFIYGQNYKQVDLDQFQHVYINFLSQSTSIKNFKHTIVQLRKPNENNTYEFSYFDYGMKGNEILYNQTTPPTYDVRKVTAKTYLVVSPDDVFCQPKEIDRLVSLLPNVTDRYSVPERPWTHMDMIWGKDVGSQVHQYVLTSLNANLENGAA